MEKNQIIKATIVFIGNVTAIWRIFVLKCLFCSSFPPLQKTLLISFQSCKAFFVTRLTLPHVFNEHGFSVLLAFVLGHVSVVSKLLCP